MQLFYNQKLCNNIDIISHDPAIKSSADFWGNNGIYYKSAIPIHIFNSPFGSISLLYGPRQIGKTSSLKLFASKVDDSDTVIVTDCSTVLHRQDLAQHLARLIAGKTTIILDEVQSVDGWHLALRSLYQEGLLRECRVWCTGSEARHILEGGERLPGRKAAGRVVFARPWSFREYVDFFHPEVAEPYRGVDIRHRNQRWLEAQDASDWGKPWGEYLVCGGFPRTIAEYREGGALADATFQAYQDWILGAWGRIRTPQRSLTALAKRIIDTQQSRVSMESLRKGTDIASVHTVKSLIEIQEDHLSLRVIPKWNWQERRFMPAKQKKVYPTDPWTASVWKSIALQKRREVYPVYEGDPFGECALACQFYRYEVENDNVGFIYSETSKAEVDFIWDGIAFELKSNGSPNPKQAQILKSMDHAFAVRRAHLPLVAYLVGEDSSALRA